MLQLALVIDISEAVIVTSSLIVADDEELLNVTFSSIV
jgi:hypothetical protein